jgi:hypothetical protein
MIIFVILIALTVVVLATLIFTNEGWSDYSEKSQVVSTLKNELMQNKPYNNYINSNPHGDVNTHVRREYRLPYRYPVGFLYENPEGHVSSIHAYDINS